MNNLALAYVTCDKYSHIWNEWYGNFKRYWDIDLWCYYLGEEKPCPFGGFMDIPHERVEAENWTTKLRAQIEKIPHENIFVWLDDLVPRKKITQEFIQIYSLFKIFKADSFRIMPRASKSNMLIVPFSISKYQVYKLNPGPYMVSFHPCIFRKEYLLEVLENDESPWDCEINSRERIKGREIYHIEIDGWVSNEIVKGIEQ